MFAHLSTSGLKRKTNGMAKGPRKTTKSVRNSVAFTLLLLAIMSQMIALATQTSIGIYAPIFNSLPPSMIEIIIPRSTTIRNTSPTRSMNGSAGQSSLKPSDRTVEPIAAPSAPFTVVFFQNIVNTKIAVMPGVKNRL